MLNLNLVYNRKFKISLKLNYKEKFALTRRLESIEEQRVTLQDRAKKYMSLFSENSDALEGYMRMSPSIVEGQRL